MSKYIIKTFTNAIGPAREKSRFTYLNFYGQKVDIPYIIWLIEGDGKQILVDSGCSAYQYETIIKGGNPEDFIAGGEQFSDVKDETSFEDGLAAWGLKPEDIDTVIVTHLHWDHIMNLGKLVNARIIVQKAEWETALSPHPLHQFAYAGRGCYEGLRNLEFVEGDTELYPGIDLIFSPGHTPGGQSVLVQTEKGKLAIAGFCSLTDNFYPPKPLQEQLGYSVIPASVHTDVTQAYQSTLKLVQIADRVLPAHEIALAKEGGIFGI
jgi:glyoxylase-like metal-dependent hydrolase (beta-lactamase superfamily II)